MTFIFILPVRPRRQDENESHIHLLLDVANGSH